MGKVDDMRAMREARYGVASKATPVTKREDLCGHRAISGKTCTRPGDHTEKNHRYS